MVVYNIDKDEAKELIDNSRFAYIFVADMYPVPTVGTIPIGELELEITIEVYAVRDKKNE